MKTKTLYKNRKWLNKIKDRTAFIMCVVDREPPIKDIGESKPCLTGEIKIADCGKMICLDLWCRTKPDRDNTLSKLDTLIDELSKVREVIENES